MPRHRCCGRVEDSPICQKFLPEINNHDEEITLLLEEFEAIRLKDHQGLDQVECANVMGLSRPTYQRILHAARIKLATALVEGRTLQIEGGNFVMDKRVFECVDCGNVWEEESCSNGGKHGYEIACPKCASMKKMKIQAGVKHACGGHQHQHGHAHGTGQGCCGK